MSHLFAVIPAAGLSRRMGRPKLLLELGGRTVMACLLETLAAAPIADAVVVVRRDDLELAGEVRRQGGSLVLPDVDPPDMRTSVEHALQDIESRHAPDPQDGWLLIPADHPVLDAEILQDLCRIWRTGKSQILVPTFAGRRGHPAFFRWRLAGEVRQLSPNVGLNDLLRRDALQVKEVPVDSDSVLLDLDTPEDLAQLRERLGE